MFTSLVKSVSACRRFFSYGAKVSPSAGSYAKRCSYALNDLDLKLLEHIPYNGGLFIEAGANDGLSQSNTLLLERERKWSGLLIEPVPYLAAQCRGNRPNCRTINAALVPIGYADAEIEMWTCGLMSFVEGAFKTDSEADAHLANSQAVAQPQPVKCAVPARSLSEILDEHGVSKVDLLSLDVEGFEAQALEGIDFDKHSIQNILVEARYRDDVERVLRPFYRLVAELSPRDLLYRRIA
jgi:FkbM family methyltransferase